MSLEMLEARMQMQQSGGLQALDAAQRPQQQRLPPPPMMRPPPPGMMGPPPNMPQVGAAADTPPKHTHTLSHIKCCQWTASPAPNGTDVCARYHSEF